MFWKAISKLFGLALLAVVLGVIALGGYFWYKSGQPMQVEAAQRMAPGITFRDFWQSRVEQWKVWDEDLRSVGRNGSCLETGNTMLVFRTIASGPFAMDLRLHRQDTQYTRALIDANNGAVPSEKFLYESNFLDAWWATVEEVNWWAYSHYPGGFPVKELGQRHACSTKYPTPAKSGD